MNFYTRHFISIILTALFTMPVLATEPTIDTTQSVDDRVSDLISRMTLSEKIQQLGNNAPSISRLGIPSYNYWNEGIHGVARSGLATSFPVSIALSSTWDPDLMFRVATAISEEARVKNNTEGKGLTYWSPTINMARDPRWGRSEENYGEDVYLASRMAVSFIKGMQGDDPVYLKTVATAKHFACNNIELNRYRISSDVDERNLREYYLPVFKACVEEGKVQSIMSAYNAVNGVPSPANRTLLTHILRDEWGFTGYVVSDCDAAGNVWNAHHYVQTGPEATALSIRNGTDLNCGTTYPDNANQAVSTGILSEGDIDEALKRVFRARFLLGEFDPADAVPYRSIPADRLDCQEYRDLALQAAREAIVLLKNENATLPLHKDSIKTIAVIGPNAKAVQLGGYSGTPSVSVSPLQGIADKLVIDISTGIIEAEDFSGQYGIQTEACTEGGSNIGYIENSDYVYYDSVDFGTGKAKLELRVASNTSGGYMEVLLDSIDGQSLGYITVPGTGGWQNWITLTVDVPQITGKRTIFIKFYGGAGYLFNINWFRLFNPGDEDPTGGGGVISYAQGCTITGSKVQSEFDKAIDFARNSDVAVVVCGTDLSVADESHDRTSLNLPGVQEQLIKEVFRANNRTVVILVTGASLAVNWAQDSIPAILCAWYDGQSQGTAIADVLFGDYNPGGRLSTTWYRSTTDLPSMNDYNIRNNRTYMYFEGDPLYPFGHGLSYTTFEYSNLTVEPQSLSAGDSLTVNVDVKNNGIIPGDEVVQLYLHVHSNIIRPIKELKGFNRINLQEGEKKTVSFRLHHKDLQYNDEVSRTFRVEDGQVDILVGSSSDDIRLQGAISVIGDTIESTYRQDPFAILEAENYEGKSGQVTIKPAVQNGLGAYLNGNNSHIVIKNVDFNQAAYQFSVQISSTDANSSLTIVLDSINGETAGTLNIATTAGMESFEVQSCVLNGISGIHDIYLLLNGLTTAKCIVDWFSFQEKVTSTDQVMTPEKLAGYQVRLYPNPSGSRFTLSYNLPEISDTDIYIYTLQGVSVFSRRLENQPKGMHTIEYDIDDQQLSQGLYILKFHAKAFTQSMVFNIVR